MLVACLLLGFLLKTTNTIKPAMFFSCVKLNLAEYLRVCLEDSQTEDLTSSYVWITLFFSLHPINFTLCKSCQSCGLPTSLNRHESHWKIMLKCIPFIQMQCARTLHFILWWPDIIKIINLSDHSVSKGRLVFLFLMSMND